MEIAKKITLLNGHAPMADTLFGRRSLSPRMSVVRSPRTYQLNEEGLSHETH